MTEPQEDTAADGFTGDLAGNRLPRTDRLAGRELRIAEATEDDLVLGFRTGDVVEWRRGAHGGTDWYEAIEVRPEVWFLTLRREDGPRHADVLVVREDTGCTLRVASDVAPEPTPGWPRVGQTFTPGTLAAAEAPGAEPGPTRDLIGWRALYRYGPGLVYEHVYLNSERYAWQCLAGAQRGQGDVDLATTWSLGDGLYVFTFREFLIPVATTWLYDLDAMRTTGTFLALGADDTVTCGAGGAYITELGRVRYPDDQPV
ncbi:MoaF C-terminal domain-containing protein [Spongiactinospora sp. TRM90649]|uniref:MoaF C-terminal domain-containing protein n=1 Tax=Spongiactinospora sp. TRM90649 TaxID=3031114 RepID=UPI0023F92E8E|nr:MoaF C-terminal domain-containing protein [Spongiactinospora sp. TRM90649]MDF5753531.1 MoaF C-terminal domain-containing protein [Spongiactinospora sp. TRM90649]